MRKRNIATATLLIAALAVGSASASIISIDFNNTTAANWIVSGTQTAGPLSSAYWNTTSTAAGGPQALIDDAGAATTATITWSSANTWNAGDGNTTMDKRINHVYLDDGGTGASITIANVPYASYRVYGLIGNAEGAEYSARNFEVNGSWVWGTDRNDQADAYGTIDGAIAGSGSSWVEVERGVTRGNYWTFETTGSTLVVNGIDRWDGGRGSISGVIIEQIPEPATLGLVALFGGGLLFIRRMLTI